MVSFYVGQNSVKVVTVTQNEIVTSVVTIFETSFITLTSANLQSGTASNSTMRGTANIIFSLSNNGSSTVITSMELTGSGLAPTTVYQCSSSTSCSAINNAVVNAQSVTSVSFYFSSAINNSQTYNYVIDFANGQSVSGSLIAQ